MTRTIPSHAADNSRCPEYERILLDELNARRFLNRHQRRPGKLDLARIEQDYCEAVSRRRDGSQMDGPVREGGVPPGVAQGRSVLYAMLTYSLSAYRLEEDDPFRAYRKLVFQQPPELLFAEAYIEIPVDGQTKVPVWFTLGECLLVMAAKTDNRMTMDPEPSAHMSNIYMDRLLGRFDDRVPAWGEAYAALWRAPRLRALALLLRSPTQLRWQAALAACLAPISEISALNAASLIRQDTQHIPPEGDWHRWGRVRQMLIEARPDLQTLAVDAENLDALKKADAYPLEQVVSKQSHRARWWRQALLAARLTPHPEPARAPVPRL